MNEKQENLTSKFSWWLIGGTFVLLIYFLSPILAPFLTAAILAYICNPLVNKLFNLSLNIPFKGKLRKFYLSRTVASLLVMLMLLAVIMLLLLIVVPLLQKEILLVIEQVPSYIAKIRQWLEPVIMKTFNVPLNIDAAQLQKMLGSNWKSAGGILGNILLSVGSQGFAVIGWLVNLLLIPVVLFYMLRDWDVMIATIRDLIPLKLVGKTTEITQQIDEVLAEFLRGQLTVMLSMSAFYAIGLWMAGLELALPIGILSGLLGFVPYLGIGLGMVLALFSGLLEFNSLEQLIPILVVFGIGQMVESMWLTPTLVGDRIGLHPVIVIFALLAGGQLFGFTGVLLALPASAAIAVALRHVRARYLHSRLYQ